MNIDNQSINSNAAPRWIEMVQKQLIRENPSALPGYGVDGSYGPETVEWVEKFQSRKGLAVDGNAGPKTLATLRSAIDLLPGMDGRGIELLQEDLLYFYIQQSTVDGSYGPSTEQGVRDFQFLNNLEVDGFAGPNTLKTMDKYITDLIIQRGANGSHVRRIQNQLNEQSEVAISIEIDGNYGPGTEAAVENFQETTDLEVDGIVGPFTRNLLDAEATHPLSDEDLEDFFESKGFSTVEASNSEAEAFVNTLENSSVYSGAVSENNKKIVNTFVTRVFRNDTGLACVFGELESNENKAIFGTISLESKEVFSVGVIEMEGQSFNDLVTLTVYDEEGQQVERIEELFVELINEDLALHVIFSEGWEEARRIQTAAFLTPCQLTTGVAGGIANHVAVKVGALLAGGAVGLVTASVGSVVMGAVFREWYCN